MVCIGIKLVSIVINFVVGCGLDRVGVCLW